MSGDLEKLLLKPPKNGAHIYHLKATEKKCLIYIMKEIIPCGGEFKLTMQLKILLNIHTLQRILQSLTVTADMLLQHTFSGCLVLEGDESKFINFWPRQMSIHNILDMLWASIGSI